MKKLLMIIAIVLFGFTDVNGQDKMEFGIKGGVNLSDITGDGVESFDGRKCFHFGVVMEIPISKKLSFQSELLYSCQGSDYGGIVDSSIDEPTTVIRKASTYDGTIKVDYLNVPLLAKYYIVEGLHAEVGPQVGFLLSAKNEYESDFDSGEDDIKDYVKGIDFGIDFGLGYKLDNGINFGARYNLGLTDSNDDPDLVNVTYKNSVIQFSLGYFF